MKSKEEQQLSMIVSLLLKKLGVDELEITKKELFETIKDKDYAGISVMEKEEDDTKVIIKRIKMEDVDKYINHELSRLLKNLNDLLED